MTICQFGLESDTFALSTVDKDAPVQVEEDTPIDENAPFQVEEEVTDDQAK